MAKKRKIPCRFTSVGLQLEHRKIGVEIGRERLDIESADELFCGRRLTGTVEVTTDNEDPDQVPLFDGQLPSVTASFDVKSFTAKPEVFTLGLVFAKDDVDPVTLDRFLKRSGRMTVTDVMEIPEDPEE